MSKKLFRGLAVGTVVFMASVVLQSINVLRPLEWKSWDLRLRLLSRPSQASGDIVLILIDQESLDIYEKSQGMSWPWPRQMYAVFADYMRAGGAKALFLDLILSETSRYGVEDDEALSRAMAASGNVFVPFFLSGEVKDRDADAVRQLKRFSLPMGHYPKRAVQPLHSVSLPVEALLRSAAGAGNVRFAQDEDSIFRRLPLLFSYEGLLLPSLPLAMAEFVMGKPPEGGIPLDGSGQMIIRYHSPAGTYKNYSAAAIINSWAQMDAGKAPQIDPKEFEGKIVLLGASAPGLLDLRPTSLSSVCSGTEIQAAALDNLLHQDFVRITPLAVLFLYVLALAILTAVGVTYSIKIWKIAVFLAACLALPAAASALAFREGFWFDFALPETAVLTSFIGAALLNYSHEGRQRRFIKSVFRHYLSPDVIERILQNPSLLDLGGERREISAFFSDLAGFTSISEGLSPEELVDLLNVYLSEMTDIILSTGGTLDKYEGDAIIAFWNAPLDQPDHALRACRAALKCQKRLAEFRPEFKRRFGSVVFARIGINSGPAVVGNMGSKKRFDYTAMGDTMNLASRLEGACKQYKIATLISEETRGMVKEAIITREIDQIRVVGKKKPIRIFELIGNKEETAAGEVEKAALFEDGIKAYRNRDWDAAIDVFRKLGEDVPAEIYVRRCMAFKQTPPPPNWDGVFELREK